MKENGASSLGVVPSSTPAYLMQYITTFSVMMGAFSFGITLGYTSPAGPMLMNNSTNDGSLILSSGENSWFTSSLNLGALVGGPLGGLVINVAGRRWTMMGSVVLLLVSWALIGFGQNFAMLVSGRVIAGLYTGLTCVNLPTYVGELASPEIRGMLGTSFQTMVVTGILFSYVMGAFVTSWRALAGVCAIPPVIYAALVFFLVKESPSILVARGKYKEAREVLKHFRGKSYNVEPELEVLRQTQEESAQNKSSLKDLKAPYVLKPLIICVGLMVFQQFSGINPVLFNLNNIFTSANTAMDEDVNAIIVGLVLVLASVVSAFLCDRLGRKFLLIFSTIAMCISLVALDLFFYEKSVNEVMAEENLAWLPLTSLIVFIATFSIGYGPIPWVLMGEVFTANVRDRASGISIVANWGSSFLVTLFFQPLQDAIGPYGVYWFFAAFCLLNLAFCVMVVPETKGKTLEEITAYFGGPTSQKATNNSSYNNPIFTMESMSEIIPEDSPNGPSTYCTAD